MKNQKHRLKIKNKFLIYSIFNLCFLFLIFYLLSSVTFAQTPENTRDFLPLVTCGVGEDAKPCKICDIWVLANRVVNFILFLAAPILTIVLIASGFIYLTSGGNPKKTEQAKSLLTSAIFGIIISLAAWLIVSTILKTLVKEELVPPWTRISTNDCPDPLKPPDVDIKKLQELIKKGGTVPTTEGGEFGTEAQAQAFFTHAGIQIVSTGNCSDQQKPECTSLVGYPVTSATKLINLVEVMSVGVRITGGTEVGHSESGDHGIGKTGIDLKPVNPTQTNYKFIRDQIRVVLGGTAHCESSKDAQGKVSIIPDCGRGTSHVHATIPR